MLLTSPILTPTKDNSFKSFKEANSIVSGINRQEPAARPLPKPRIARRINTISKVVTEPERLASAAITCVSSIKSSSPNICLPINTRSKVVTPLSIAVFFSGVTV